jgi:hypothetical protein
MPLPAGGVLRWLTDVGAGVLQRCGAVLLDFEFGDNAVVDEIGRAPAVPSVLRNWPSEFGGLEPVTPNRITIARRRTKSPQTFAETDDKH